MSDLFSNYLKGVKPVVPQALVNGRVKIKPESRMDWSDSSSDDEMNQGTSYAKQYVEKEMQKYANAPKYEETDDYQCSVDNIVDDLVDSEMRSEVYRNAGMTEVYQKYDFDYTLTRKDLTIHSYRREILESVRDNSVVIIDGPTGCGKTTQVPQFLLDDCRSYERPCKIIVTQPRKIATINVAKRVCLERGWTLGSICGYQIGLDKQVGPDCILLYMTTGVLLQKLIHSQSLLDYSHIIIDEVHERNRDLDFLLLIVRRLLFSKSFPTKVILMSATINALEFADYFRMRFMGEEIPAPIIRITEPNKFKVISSYLDDLPPFKNVQNVHFTIEKPEITPCMNDAFFFLLYTFDSLDKASASNQEQLGSVLVFLPGIREIQDLINELNKKQNSSGERNGAKWECIPLHSSLPNDEQAKVFKAVEPPCRKIILSTNLAESSITVPDVCYVIDFCLTKNLIMDEITKFCCLQLEWASQVNCDQRAGRAGRVANGRVYRLVPKEFYKSLPKKGTPEILRAPLEQIVLQTKMLGLKEEPKAILALAINPPNLRNIENTVWQLKAIGGMLRTCRGLEHIWDGDITFLGTVMASLPLDVCLTKLIVLGHIFGILPEAIIIAAGCCIQNIFTIPFHQRYHAYNKKLVWSDGTCSDLIALLNLYKVWQSFRREGAFKKPREEFAWCKSNLVSLKGLREWQLLVDEIHERLKRLSIEETTGPTRVNLLGTERATALRVIICGAFYPNYFIRSASDGQIDEGEASRTLSSRDPYRSVYLTGMVPRQPACLYKEQIMKMLEITDKADIELDDTSKIYVVFNKELETVTVDGHSTIAKIPGKIEMPVYQAVKRRQLGLTLELDVLPTEQAWSHLKKLQEIQSSKTEGGSSVEEDTETNCFSKQTYDPIPTRDIQYITVTISHRIDTGHFYCQNVGDETHDTLNNINKLLNTYPLNKISVDNVDINKMYACQYKLDNQFYRVKIQTKLSATQVQLMFVDYGNREKHQISDLCELPNNPVLKSKPLAFECRLSEVEPVYNVHHGAIWSENLNKLFDKQTQNMILYGKIYSVCNNVVRLELFKKLPSRTQNTANLSINQWLINEGHARKIQESHESRQDHGLRKYVLESENPSTEAKKVDKVKAVEVNVVPSMEGVEKYLKKIPLKGPFSPLEMSVHSVIAHGSNKYVGIDPASVNSVLLDSDPTDPHTRLVVAGMVSQTSGSGDRLTLRQTTIMPNLPGFPFIMALIFCPVMEPKLTDDGNRISSLLCGLGSFKDSGRAYFPAGDMVLTLDVCLKENEINLVNEIRYLMNTAIKTMEEIKLGNAVVRDFENCQRSVKKKIFQLLDHKLESVPLNHTRDAHVWGNYPIDSEILHPPKTDEDEIWPLHWCHKIREVNEEILEYEKQIELMLRMAKRLTPFEKIICPICDEDLTLVDQLRMHLISQEHKQNETRLGILCHRN